MCSGLRAGIFIVSGLLLAMVGDVWLRLMMAMAGSVWLCLAMPGYVWPCVAWMWRGHVSSIGRRAPSPSPMTAKTQPAMISKT